MAPGDDATVQDQDRLNGWKEIASFLGKGVRTVQRWERELGLPVHRLGREGGEIVFAFRAEITDWSLAQDAGRHRSAPDVPGNGAAGGADVTQAGQPASGVPRRRGHLAAAGLVLVAATTAAVLLLDTGWTGRSPQPVAWRVTGDSLEVLDAGGVSLWTHQFPVTLSQYQYSADVYPSAERVSIVDLDGDGYREVLFGLRAADLRGPTQGFWIFGHDGSPKFDFHPANTVRFGSVEYRAPWLFHRLIVTRRPDGGPTLWVVFTHAMEFPSLLVEIDPHGAITSEYWSDGFIDAVAETTWDGQPAIVVGATNNETQGASLAIFDRDRVTGSAPAVDPAYRCTDCPPGAPLEFVLFPRTCIARAIGGQPAVDSVWMDAGRRLHVSVSELNPLRPSTLPNVWYWLGPDLRPERAELSGELLSTHRELERAGILDHPFGPADEADLFPVRRWDGTRFVDLPPAPVTR